MSVALPPLGAVPRSPGKDAQRVLFVAAECTPWAKSGGLGDVVASLSVAVREQGADARLLLPGYGTVKAALVSTGADAQPCPIPAEAAFPQARLLSGQTPAGVPVWVVDCPQLYERDGTLYTDPTGVDWPDNALRFALLARVAALLAQGLLKTAWTPQILHCHDWHSGLAPAYLHYAGAHHIPSLMTVHNIAYQGNYPAGQSSALGLPDHALTPDGIEFYGQLSFLKAGLRFATRINTVSPTHALEIQTPEGGFGLDGLLRHRQAVLSGILNGYDTTEWNCASDPHVTHPYDRTRLEAKRGNTISLLNRIGLSYDPAIPVLGVVSRLAHQKGLDVLLEAAPALLAMPARLVVLGSGDAKLEQSFRELALIHPESCAVTIGFDEGLAHLIEAGADMFVMPSRYEPCGLNQMYSLAYGTPPIVHATGGLADTVIDCTPANLAAGYANGFSFDTLDAATVIQTVRRALDAWHDASVWQRLQDNGMRLDHSWNAGARRYLDLYTAMLEDAKGTHN